MLRGLYAAATGMEAQTTRIAAIANNLANVSTTGYKKERVDFQDLFYDRVQAPGSGTDGGASPAGVTLGLGVRVAGVSRVFSPGALRSTAVPLDLAIEGEGFFSVRMPDGTVGYTRDGAFRRDGEGRVVTLDGYPLVPDLTIPADATSVSVGPDGVVRAAGATGEGVEIGQLQLARFPNPAALSPLGRNLFGETSGAGGPVEAAPGTEGAGTVAQGFLEESNVNVAEELVAMIVAQRAYEMTSKVVSASDEMLQRASSLR